MAMHGSEDANSSDHFDGNNKHPVFLLGGDKTNERVKLGVRRKRRKGLMSSLGKPFALMKTSRIKKNVIPIGKEVGGYKKAQKHQHSHWDVKKRSQGKKSIAQLRESESGKTHIKDLVESFGSKTDPSEDEEDEEDEEDSEDDFCGMRSRRKEWFKSDRIEYLGGNPFPPLHPDYFAEPEMG
ncbi:unnamed protein product [Lactuca saligna]|uniref:Uncharacterized protein n=1 Tax=Lactuca saligna TaxID=75948 RepID=A0AA36A1C2_LACSI|nr:unnamed protein product [Lactuca saligna]